MTQLKRTQREWTAYCERQQRFYYRKGLKWALRVAEMRLYASSVAGAIEAELDRLEPPKYLPVVREKT